MKVLNKILIEKAAESLYESLHRGECAGLPFDQIPEEERALWITNAAKWMRSFAAASMELVASEFADAVGKEVLKHEFPMDTTSRLMVVRTEAVLDAIEKLKRPGNLI